MSGQPIIILCMLNLKWLEVCKLSDKWMTFSNMRSEELRPETELRIIITDDEGRGKRLQNEKTRSSNKYSYF